MAYFAEVGVRLGAWAGRALASAGGIGVALDEFNTVVGFDAAAGTEAAKEAAKAFRMGDVVLEIEGTSKAGRRHSVDTVGRTIPWAEFGSLANIRLMREKGHVPLGAGVVARPCRCLLNRVNADACAFEIDLSGAVAPASLGPHKMRYVFICAGRDEAEGWLDDVSGVLRKHDDEGATSLS